MASRQNNRRPSSQQTPHSFNEEREHYKSLISLFKYALTVVPILITLIGGAIGWLTYNNGQEMRQAMKEEREYLDKNVDEMKSDVESERLRLRELEKEMFDNVFYVRNQTDRQISTIRGEASVMAKTEARNRIDQVFKDNNFEEFVEDIAQERMVPQIKTLVDENMGAFLDKVQKQKTDEAINNILSDDRQKIGVGLQYLQLSIYQNVQLTDEQIVKMILFIKRSDIEEQIRYPSSSILAYQKSNRLISEFFMEELSHKEVNEMCRNYAMIYFSKADLEFNINTYEKIIEEAPIKGDMFLSLINTASQINKPLILELMNSREIINMVLREVPKENYENFKQGIIYTLNSSGLDSARLSKTYFFTRP